MEAETKASTSTQTVQYKTGAVKTQFLTLFLVIYVIVGVSSAFSLVTSTSLQTAKEHEQESSKSQTMFFLQIINDSSTSSHQESQYSAAAGNKSSSSDLHTILLRRPRSSSPYSYERKVLHRAQEGPPKIQATRTNVEAVVGSNVTLECFIDSYPKAVNYWMMDSERLRGNSEKFRITDDPINIRNFEFRHRLRLYIYNIDGPDYSNIFRCFSTNEHGTNNKAIIISGHLPIIESVNNVTTIESSVGSDFTLECIISAVPDAINYWTRGSKDEQIHASPKYSITSQSYNNHRSKTITKLQVFDVRITDLTDYRCKSKNRIGEAEKKFQVIKSGYVLPKRDEKTSGAESLPSLNNIIYFASLCFTVLKLS